MSSIVETASAEKETIHVHILSIADVDVAAGLDSDKPLEGEVALRLRYVQNVVFSTRGCFDSSLLSRRKIDLHLMPLMCSQSSFE